MDYRQYTFPTLKDGINTVERTMNILLKYRKTLSHEELDYLDWAERTVYSYYNKGNHRLRVA